MAIHTGLDLRTWSTTASALLMAFPAAVTRSLCCPASNAVRTRAATSSTMLLLATRYSSDCNSRAGRAARVSDAVSFPGECRLLAATLQHYTLLGSKLLSCDTTAACRIIAGASETQLPARQLTDTDKQHSATHSDRKSRTAMSALSLHHRKCSSHVTMTAGDLLRDCSGSKPVDRAAGRKPTRSSPVWSREAKRCRHLTSGHPGRGCTIVYTASSATCPYRVRSAICWNAARVHTLTGRRLHPSAEAPPFQHTPPDSVTEGSPKAHSTRNHILILLSCSSKFYLSPNNRRQGRVNNAVITLPAHYVIPEFYTCKIGNAAVQHIIQYR